MYKKSCLQWLGIYGGLELELELTCIIRDQRIKRETRRQTLRTTHRDFVLAQYQVGSESCRRTIEWLNLVSILLWFGYELVINGPRSQ